MFLLEYIKNPKVVGAVKPSSPTLANKMLESVDFNKVNCIVEYGPGTGVFTEKILARVKEDALVILIEKNEEFFKILTNLYGYKNNVIILNDGAENIESILKEHNVSKVDYIISGLPFTIFSKELSDTILDKTVKVLGDDGEFITFQYSLVLNKLFNNFFSNIKIDRTFKNIPPAYVLKCRV